MRVDAFLTRTGVFVYRNADGTERREYRPPEEVFHADALDSFAMVPVTDDHPSEMVTAANARTYAVGWTGETVRQDGNHVAASMVLFDGTTVSKADAGKREVSCGYTCELEETPGVTPDGEHYDAIQREIRGNHVALVDAGRAGPSARIRMDGQSVDLAVMVRADSAAQKGNIMDELKKALSDLAEAQVKLAAEKARADAAEKERDAEKARADKLEGERDAEKARADAAEKARTDAAEKFDAQVQARVDLVSKASAVLGDDFKADGKSDREIKVAVVEKVDGVKVEAEKADAYVDARFDSAIERAEKADESLANVRKAANEARKDGKSVADARAAMVERNRKLAEEKE